MIKIIKIEKYELGQAIFVSTFDKMVKEVAIDGKMFNLLPGFFIPDSLKINANLPIGHKDNNNINENQAGLLINEDNTENYKFAHLSDLMLGNMYGFAVHDP